MAAEAVQCDLFEVEVGDMVAEYLGIQPAAESFYRFAGLFFLAS